MKRITLAIVALAFLAGCKSDESPRATQLKYFALDEAYRKCVGWPQTNGNVQQRLECTRAVYGGGQ